MAASKGKNLNPIYVLTVLYKYSDEDHHLFLEPSTSEKDKDHPNIVELIKDEFGIDIERKAVGAAIGNLKGKLDFVDIQRDDQGFYLKERFFSDSELELLIDAVRSSKYISADDSKDIVDKLSSMGSISFSSTFKNIIVMESKEKRSNRDIFLTVETIESAIENGQDISFEYTSWHRNAEKREERSGEQKRMPICLLYMDQRYYVVTAYKDDGGVLHTEYFALDKMENTKSIPKTGRNIITDAEKKKIREEEIPQNANRSEPVDLKREKIRFHASDIIMHSVEENFGKNADPGSETVVSKTIIKSPQDERFPNDVTVKTTEETFMQFLRQNMNEIQLIGPDDVVEKFKAELETVLKLY